MIKKKNIMNVLLTDVSSVHSIKYVVNAITIHIYMRINALNNVLFIQSKKMHNA